jgi:hypothetical protein
LEIGEGGRLPHPPGVIGNPGEGNGTILAHLAEQADNGRLYSFSVFWMTPRTVRA